MVESAENGSAPNRVARRNTVSMAAFRDGRTQRGGYSRPQTHVWTRVVEMRDPCLQNELEMPFIERNEKVQTFAAVLVST